MKKEYEIPEIIFEIFDSEDIITASGNGGGLQTGLKFNKSDNGINSIYFK